MPSDLSMAQVNCCWMVIAVLLIGEGLDEREIFRHPMYCFSFADAMQTMIDYVAPRAYNRMGFQVYYRERGYPRGQRGWRMGPLEQYLA